ncbi:hypothetical protein GIB67_041852 [Kingdonia uniflora]|uniref:DUF7788 domain-containing protein n=1 Tax=Kingdonia uniflora TaxID=39325 RepID=A0A7J7L5Z4_9MAGN|nr:hypothetical protein GIB67_041852 [Kingdonia uniflora]
MTDRFLEYLGKVKSGKEKIASGALLPHEIIESLKHSDGGEVAELQWEKKDFQKVFDLILQVAVKGKLREEDMIKRVFVFSDMEFDKVSANNWETDYKRIQRKFKASGYESVVPEIVFWNLRDSKATPVPSKEKGVALVSGFSKNLLKMFLNEDGIINPEAVMEKAISGDEYQKLQVHD